MSELGGSRSAAELPLPTFVVIGAQKAGTHWIRHNLRRRPEVFMPEDELHFFTRPEAVAAQGLDGYRRLFAGWSGQPVVGEATPGYLMWRHDPAAMAAAMHRLLPDLRLVAVLRDPVDRARSALVHFRRLGVLGPDETDLVRVVEANLPAAGHDLGLIAGGWYASSLRPYLDRFGDQVLVLLHDDLASDPVGTYDRLVAHLGLAAGWHPPGLDERRFAFDGAGYGVPPLDDAQRATLYPHVGAEVDALEVLLDRDLSAWRPRGVLPPAGRPVPAPGAAGGRRRPSPGGDPVVPAVASPPSLADARLVDLGCGAGDSLVRAQERFGLRGVGVDVDPAKLDRARQRGLAVELGDVLDLDPAALAAAEVVQLDNVLEHLPSLDEVDRALGLAVRSASRLVVVRHPSFEDVDRLAALGLKLYWTDWTGHTAPARLAELVALLHGHGCYDLAVTPFGPIRDSADGSVLPLDAPPDQQRRAPDVPGVYEAARHGPKPEVRFDWPVFRGFELVVRCHGGPPWLATGAALPTDDEVPGQAPAAWPARLVLAGDEVPQVRRRPAGDTVVVEAGTLRKIASPVVARALEKLFGVSEATARELAPLLPGPPVVALKRTGAPSFVVVGGRRHDLPALGFTLHVADDGFDGLPAGPPLDVLGAAAELARERAARRARQP